jgi:hypothetical protein
MFIDNPNNPKRRGQMKNQTYKEKPVSQRTLVEGDGKKIVIKSFKQYKGGKSRTDVTTVDQSTINKAKKVKTPEELRDLLRDHHRQLKLTSEAERNNECMKARSVTRTANIVADKIGREDLIVRYGNQNGEAEAKPKAKTVAKKVAPKATPKKEAAKK